MNIFFKQAVRNPVFTVFMVLLLGLSIALSCIGYSAWTSARIQRDEISVGYTTIAIIKAPDVTGLTSGEEIGLEVQKKMLADWAAQEAPQLAMIDRRCLLSAHVADCKSLSSSRLDPVEYNIAFDSECYALAVFALRCERVRETNTEGILQYDAKFRVEETVCLSDAYDCFPAPDIIHIMSDVREADGTVPFVKGKTYLVFGEYQDYRVVQPFGQSDEAYMQMKEGEKRYITPFPEMSSNVSDEPSSLKTGYLRGRNAYRYPAAGQDPWAAEYTGTVADYLSSEAGAVWRDKIIPLCQLNQASAPVILTDRVTSMYSFNTEAASLLSGRFFTDKEYQEGADVCIVSASYAEVNDLQLGDTLRLDYYDSGHMARTNGGVANSLFGGGASNPYVQRNCMRPEAAIGVCKEYTIVGTYTGPRFAFGAYHMNADTILAPKASVPNAQEYEKPSSSFLNTFVLENGSAEEFEQYMEQQDLGGQFLYFDQDFSAMEESLKALEENAMRLLLVGVGVFLLISVLFLFLNFRRMKSTLRGARLLGRPAKSVFGEIVAVLLPLELLAVLLGAAAAAALFDTVTRAVLSNVLALRPETILTASAAAFAVHACVSMASAAISANRKLMKSK